MTPKQAAVLQAIRDLTVDGVPPSYPEMQVHSGISSRSSMHKIIYELVRLGRITVEPGKRRSIRVLDQGPARDEMERWSDDEIERVGGSLIEIASARILARRAAA